MTQDLDNNANNIDLKHPITEPAPLGMSEHKQFEVQQQQHKKVLWGIFCLLIVLLLTVFWALPKYIGTPNTAPSVVIVDSSSDNATTQISPFAEAQMLAQREDAQAVLANLLELQDSLTVQQVEVWAEGDIAKTLEHALAGDESYRQQDYISAKNYYQLGLTQLQQIEAQLPLVLNDAIIRGDTAILDGNPTIAEQSFSLALLLNPDNAEAQSGYDRAQLLPRVLVLIERARQLNNNQQFESAIDLYQQALAIDPLHIDANKLLVKDKIAIVERDFAAAMSAGYAYIQQDFPQQAKTAFDQALTLKPGSADASSALALATDQITFSAIDRYLSTATNHKLAERWQQTISAYDSALSIDPNLVTAVNGKSAAISRNNLDQYLIMTLAEPLRLADPAVYKQAMQVLQDARKVLPPKERLNTQLTLFSSLLEQVQRSSDVTFHSDGLTNVTIYQVGVLGQFTNQKLSLTPGTYVAIGIRDGFRDAREEFTIAINGSSPLVIIQCDEKI